MLPTAQLLRAAEKLTKINKPTNGEYQSVKNWLRGEKPVKGAESRWITHKEDLITLRPGREYAWLDAGVERVLRVCGGGLTRWVFQSAETRLKTAKSSTDKNDDQDDADDHDHTEVHYTRSRIERLVVLIITLMILVLLVLPIYVLYELSGEDDEPGNEGDKHGSRRDLECIGVLLVFTLAFSACISLFTRARRHEILAASAA